MKRRNLILLLGGTGSAALSTGTGAFSSASADRSVEVSVVEDESAYVGYMALPEVVEDEGDDGDDGDEQKSITVEDGERVTLLKIENRFPGDSGIGVVGIDFADDDHLFSDLAVELSDDDEYEQMEDSEVRRGPYKKGGPVPDDHAFGPGECAYVMADVHGDPTEYHIEITIRVRGTEDTGVSASIFGDTRAFKLRIEADNDNGTATVSGVEFKSGNSGVVLNTQQGDTSPGTASAGGNSSTEITASAYYEDSGEVKKTDEAEVSADKKIKLKDFDDSLDNGKRIVGIEVKGISGVFDRGQTSASGDSDNYSGTTDGTLDLQDASFYEDFVDN